MPLGHAKRKVVAVAICYVFQQVQNGEHPAAVRPTTATLNEANWSASCTVATCTARSRSKTTATSTSGSTWQRVWSVTWPFDHRSLWFRRWYSVRPTGRRNTAECLCLVLAYNNTNFHWCGDTFFALTNSNYMFQGCGLGLDVSVSRRSLDVPTSRLDLVSRRIVNVSVSAIYLSCPRPI